jgi:hypothetical protein
LNSGINESVPLASSETKSKPDSQILLLKSLLWRSFLCFPNEKQPEYEDAVQQYKLSYA